MSSITSEYDAPRLFTWRCLLYTSIFTSNSCDVTVIINPHDKECEIETGDNVWHSVEEMEAEKSEQFQEENAEADPEK